MNEWKSYPKDIVDVLVLPVAADFSIFLRLGIFGNVLMAGKDVADSGKISTFRMTVDSGFCG